jgi:hypothetical protein
MRLTYVAITSCAFLVLFEKADYNSVLEQCQVAEIGVLLDSRTWKWLSKEHLPERTINAKEIIELHKQ